MPTGVYEVSLMADLQCRYCQAMNDMEEQRCARCGRRLHLIPETVAARTLVLMTATAPAVDASFDSAPVQRAESVMDQEKISVQRRAYQPPLFDPGALHDGDGLALSKVIPIPTLTPLRPLPREDHAVRRAMVSSRTDGPARRRHHHSDSQQALEFGEAAFHSQPRVQADTIFCDAPVALPAHRVIAAVADSGAVLLALGVFLAVFYLAGGQIIFNRYTTPLLLAIAVVIGMFYRFLWCLANSDTPGMRFAGLKLVDFDGRDPRQEQRGVRQVAGLLSVLSAGLGLVWALVDEENLTWHDHISKSFPTPATR